MNDSLRISHVTACAVTVAAVVFSQAAVAETRFYKWTGSDGVTSYSQAPPPAGQGRDVQSLTVDTLPIEQQQAARRALAHMARKADAQAAVIRNRLAQADRNVSTALANLQRAESALRAGSMPLGTDRIGNFGGGTRLRESYFQRVAQLEAKVMAARETLDAAYVARNAVR